MANWHEFTENDLREIERDRDLPPDDNYTDEYTGEWDEEEDDVCTAT